MGGTLNSTMSWLPHRPLFDSRSVVIGALTVCLLQGLASCQVTSSTDGHSCAIQPPPAETSQTAWWFPNSPWLVAASVAAACSILSASFRIRLDAAVDSLVGPANQRHHDFHERIAPAVRLAGLCVVPLHAAYHVYFGNNMYPVISVVVFFVLLMTPASLPRLKLLIRVGPFVLLPCRLALQPYLLPGSVTPALMLIPPSICFPTFGALLHVSVAEQLSVALFVNAIVFSCAHTQLECTVSALATGMTITFTLFSRVCLRRTEFAPAVLDDKAWRVGALIAVPIVAAEFCIAVSSTYPGSIWHFVSEFEDMLFTAAAGVALLGSLLCLWNCQQPANNSTDNALQFHDFHERIVSNFVPAARL